MTAVGIAGVTCGGKTTLAKRLVDILREQQKTVTFVSQDDYFLPKESVEQVQSSTDPSVYFYNYDSPKAVDAIAFKTAIDAALASHQFVIVEGNMFTEMHQIDAILTRNSVVVCQSMRQI